VRNVTGTLRSIITGLSYLGTGLFAANTVGLTGLGVQTLLQSKEETPSNGSSGGDSADTAISPEEPPAQ
jgi:Protein of unknown function (DUF3082)